LFFNLVSEHYERRLILPTGNCRSRSGLRRSLMTDAGRGVVIDTLLNRLVMQISGASDQLKTRETQDRRAGK
jgi:hypothetical protein